MSPRAAGPRQTRRAKQRRRRRQQGLLVFAGAASLCVVIIAGAAWLGNQLRDQTSPTPTATPVDTAVTQQETLLLVRAQRPEGPAAGLTLLATEPETGDGFVLFLPVGTLVDIPGFGLDPLSLAHQYGGAALVEASAENLLGIDIDHVATASDSALASFLARTGGLEIEVDERLVSRDDDGTTEVRFEPGVQFLDGERLVEYWAFREQGEQEVDTFARQQQVLEALLTAADDEVVEALVGDGAPPLDTSADAPFLTSMFATLAAAAGDAQLTFDLLPVTPFGGGDEQGDATYRATPEGIQRLTTGPLAGSVPAGGGTAAIRVQVLNGVGTPGIGQRVDERLEGTGMRIVLTDNARSFDFDQTQILVYREDQRSLDAAELVRDRLGVGTIALSRQPQSVVDLTIVVGADFTGDDPFPRTEEPST